MDRKILAAVSAVTLGVTTLASAAIPSLAPLSSFGGGDGWRAPNESLAGDSVASPYPYLGISSLERGMAYNPVTGNLVLVSRSTAGNGIRLLNGTTGVDVGSLNQGSGIITGGTFTTNMVGVAADGAVYVANLQGNVTSAAFKIYQWTSESQVGPNVWFNSTVAGFGGTPRAGDAIDVTGSGASTRVVSGMSGVQAYIVVTPTGATGVSALSPTVPSTPFRLGITFAGTDNDIWGKQTSSDLRRSVFNGTATATNSGSNVLLSAGEMALDYAVIAGIPYLATLDANNSRVRIYNASNPAALELVLNGTTTSGTLTANGNATGSIKFGAIDHSLRSATIYAMSTNQGIQALTVVVPEPAALGLLAPAALLVARRRRA